MAKQTKKVFIAILVGPDGREYTSRIIAHDRREAMRIADRQGRLSGSVVVATDIDAVSAIWS